jgi:hypothetical protein
MVFVIALHSDLSRISMMLGFGLQAIILRFALQQVRSYVLCDCILAFHESPCCWAAGCKQSFCASRSFCDSLFAKQSQKPVVYQVSGLDLDLLTSWTPMLQAKVDLTLYTQRIRLFKMITLFRYTNKGNNFDLTSIAQREVGYAIRCHLAKMDTCTL